MVCGCLEWHLVLIYHSLGLGINGMSAWEMGKGEMPMFENCLALLMYEGKGWDSLRSEEGYNDTLEIKRVKMLRGFMAPYLKLVSLWEIWVYFCFNGEVEMRMEHECLHRKDEFAKCFAVSLEWKHVVSVPITLRHYKIMIKALRNM